MQLIDEIPLYTYLRVFTQAMYLLTEKMRTMKISTYKNLHLGNLKKCYFGILIIFTLFKTFPLCNFHDKKVSLNLKFFKYNGYNHSRNHCSDDSRSMEQHKLENSTTTKTHITQPFFFTPNQNKTESLYLQPLPLETSTEPPVSAQILSYPLPQCAGLSKSLL